MKIIFLLYFNVVLLLVFVIPYLIIAAIVWLITTKLISKTFKILIVIIVLLCIFIMYITLVNIKTSDLYVKMKEINDSQKLIGLSEEEVIELLGEPEKTRIYSDVNKKVYLYNAGYIFKELSLGRYTILSKTYYQVLSINFDENGKVESTLLKYSLELTN